MANKIGFTKKDIDDFLLGIYHGEITPSRLPKNLYFATAKSLMGGVMVGARDAGYRKKSGPVNAKKPVSVSFGKVDQKMVKELRENVYMFSAAKTYQQVRAAGSLLMDKDGKIIPFKEFNEQGRILFDTWNESYAESEYNTAISQARSAIKWNRFEASKSILPNLRYSAIEDESTSEECQELDGTVAPVDDPIWDECMPPNHFNCRCTVLQEDGTVEPDSDLEEIQEAATSTMDDSFKMNPGKDKVVFKDDHPYFDVAPKDQGLAERNFDLSIPDED